MSTRKKNTESPNQTDSSTIRISFHDRRPRRWPVVGNLPAGFGHLFSMNWCRTARQRAAQRCERVCDLTGRDVRHGIVQLVLQTRPYAAVARHLRPQRLLLGSVSACQDPLPQR